MVRIIILENRKWFWISYSNSKTFHFVKIKIIYHLTNILWNLGKEEKHLNKKGGNQEPRLKTWAEAEAISPGSIHEPGLKAGSARARSETFSPGLWLEPGLKSL